MPDEIKRLQEELAQIERAITEEQAQQGGDSARQRLAELQERARQLRATIKIGGDVSNSNIIVGNENSISQYVFPSANLFPSIRCTLPAPVANFVGRDREIDALVTALSSEKSTALITGIRGMGGIGKTELALVIAHRLLPQYADAQLFFELQPGGSLLTSKSLLTTIIRTFRPQVHLPEMLPDLQSLYRETLQNLRGLLILDNAASADQVNPLLPTPVGWAVLVTSRHRFPLSTGAYLQNLEVFSDIEAINLLRRLLVDGQRQDIAKEADESLLLLAKLCGHLPLALRLAAAFLSTYLDWSLNEYLTALKNDRLNYLRVDNESVARVLGFSIKRLIKDNYDLARYWQMLAVFPAPFDRAAGSTIYKLQKSSTRSYLSALCQRSLLDYVRMTDTYKLHDLLREYALTWPVPIDNKLWPTIQERHAHHYLSVADQINKLYQQGGAKMLKGLRDFDSAWPHLKHAWIWMKNKNNKASQRWLKDFPTSISSLWQLRLPPRQRIPYLETALSAAHRLGDGTATINLKIQLGMTYANLGETGRAVELCAGALIMTQQSRHRQGESIALYHIGLLYYQLGNMRLAISHYEQSLAIRHELDDQQQVAGILLNLSVAYSELGNVRRSISYCEQALAIVHQLEDHYTESLILNSFGNAYLQLGKDHHALDYYQQALTIADQLGDRHTEGVLLVNLGIVNQSLYKADCALDYYQQGLTIARQLGDRAIEALAMSNIASFYYALGKMDQALDHLEQALLINQEMKQEHEEGLNLVRQGLVYSALGELNLAFDCYQQALTIAQRNEFRYLESIAAWNLGWSYIRLRDYKQGAAMWHITVDYGQQIGHSNAKLHSTLLEMLQAYNSDDSWSYISLLVVPLLPLFHDLIVYLHRILMRFSQHIRL